MTKFAYGRAAVLPLLAALSFLSPGREGWAAQLSGGSFILRQSSLDGGAAMSGADGLAGSFSEISGCGDISERSGGELRLRCGNMASELLSRDVQNKVSSQNNLVTVTIPVGVTPSDYDIIMAVDPLSDSSRVDPAVVSEANSKLKSALGHPIEPPPQGAVELNLVLETDEYFDSNFSKQAILAFKYNDANNDGVVDGSNPPIRARTLSLWRLDEARRLWVKVPNASLDAAAKTVTASLSHFSVYSLMGTADLDVGSVYAFPVPWNPSSGKAALGNKTDGIRFTNLPTEGTVRIYDLNGRLVHLLNIPAGAGGTLAWDVKTNGGSEVASGVYHWVVEAGSNRKSGKLMVIR